jgi:hypothetical protein
MGNHRHSPVQAEVVYRSVRQEILDQKRCQFQILSAALTFSAAVLAYAASLHVSPFVYVAPMLMNVLTLTIILDKAVSIQRMVGYLQLMESYPEPHRGWMWEYHLNIFRELPGEPAGTEKHRKHTYIRNVSLILIMLNFVSLALYFWGPEAAALRSTPAYPNFARFLGSVDTAVIGLTLFGTYFAATRIRQLVRGVMTSSAVRKKWISVLTEADRRLRPGGIDSAT